MALRFSANLSWLFTGLPELPARLEAAAAAGFGAVEAAWPAGCPAQALRAAAERAGVQIVLLNTPPGDQEAGEMGLAAVPGRQAAFRQGLATAVHYARAVGCPRIHLMAGRVPVGTDRAAVAGEMETTLIENLRYAADLLAQEDMIGLVEPINNRITDPRYFLNTPHQGPLPLPDHGWEFITQPGDLLPTHRSHPDCASARAARARQPWGVELPLHLQVPGVPWLHWLRGVRVCSKRRYPGRSGLAALLLGEPRAAAWWQQQGSRVKQGNHWNKSQSNGFT
ncbi:putative hydroxypyruvate isomerase isoform 2-T2 [Chlamydotis macqueenii]